MVSKKKLKERSPQIIISVVGIIICIGLLTYMWRDGQFDSPEVEAAKIASANDTTSANMDDVVDMLLEGHPDLKDTVHEDGIISMYELGLMVNVYTAKVRLDHLDEVSAILLQESGGKDVQKTTIDNESPGNNS